MPDCILNMYVRAESFLCSLLTFCCAFSAVWLAFQDAFASSLLHAVNSMRKVMFLARSVTFLFAYEISRKPLNGFAPNLQEDVFDPSVGRV